MHIMQLNVEGLSAAKRHIIQSLAEIHYIDAYLPSGDTRQWQNGGLSQLHSADEHAVSWLTSYGSWQAYEKKKCDENASLPLI